MSRLFLFPVSLGVLLLLAALPASPAQGQTPITVNITGDELNGAYAVSPTCTITIIKETSPAGGQGFSFSSASFPDFSLNDNGSKSFSGLDVCGPPIHNVFETPKPGWALTYIACAFTAGTGDFNIIGTTTNPPTTGFEPGDNEVSFSFSSGPNVQSLECTFTNCLMTLDTNGDTILDTCAPALCPAAPGNLVENPSFEMLGGAPNQLGLPFGSGAGHPLTTAQVPGWRAGLGIGTPAQDPDILTPDLNGTDYVVPTVGYVPSNFMGNEPALGGSNYAGISAGVFTVSGVPTYLSEELIGTLPATENADYTVAAWMSEGETRNNPVDIEIFLASTNTTLPVRSAVLGQVDTKTGWQPIQGTIPVPAGYDRVIIRGDNTNDYTGGYVYIDCVSVVKVSSGRVGGTVELRGQPDAPGSGEASASSSVPYAAIAGGLAAGVLALAAGAWYARRRWLE